MFANVFLKTLRDLRRSLAWWSVSVAALVAVMAAVWPSVRAMPNLDEFLANYPEAMRELFSIESMGTGAGFLNVELFSILLPALFLVFAIGRGARMVAGEEEAGTLDVLVVTPVTRLELLLHKAGALACALLVLTAVTFGSTVVASAVVDMGVPTADAAVGSLAMFLLGLEHGWLALAVGAAVGRRATALAVGSTFAVAGYTLYLVGELVTAVEPWQPLSPFTQALADGPVGPGAPPSFAWMAVAAVAFVAAAAPVFERRDLAT